MSDREYTVTERAHIVTKAMNSPKLDSTQKRQLAELLYTMSEAGVIPRMDEEHAILLWAAIDLVKAGKFTQEMRL